MALWPCHKAGMKNKTINPTRSQFNILRQICNYIPPHEVSKIARATGAQEMSRTFKPWSHVVSLVYAQLTHSIGLNDLCDSLQLHSGPLASIRGATAASRNGLSNANRERPAEMAEQLFWRVMSSLGEQSPGFVAGRRRGAAFRFKLPIHGYGTGGQLHGLGQAPAAQGSRQNAHAAQPAKFAAQFCDYRYRRRARQ